MKNVLIVDDQEGIRLLLQEVFKQEGYQTYLAADGYEALTMAKTHCPDCVLLDMKIPGMDGITILQELKMMYPQLPVVMMTAYGEVDAQETTEKLGAVKYFSKPFNIAEVKETVNKILKG